jgi:2-haloacid dehalogenase
MPQRYEAVLFDLLTGLIDSWTLWDGIAGSEAAGRRWRGEYLRLTYGQGTYRPYTEIAADAARNAGLAPDLARHLETRWRELEPWPDASTQLTRLARAGVRLGVVTNCSEVLGRAAADLVGVPFDVVVTAERAGAYKPQPKPYALALEEIGSPAARTLFVAGSPSDIAGAAALGMDVYWHNRAQLPQPPGAASPKWETRDLAMLADVVLGA